MVDYWHLEKNYKSGHNINHVISILTIITLPGSNKTDGDVSSHISDWIVPFVQRHLKKKEYTKQNKK
jgi:hypothetical protein